MNTLTTKKGFRADGGDLSPGRITEIAHNPFGDEEKQRLAARLLTAEAKIATLLSGAMIPATIPHDVYQFIYEQCDGFVESSINAQEVWETCRRRMIQSLTASASS